MRSSAAREVMDSELALDYNALKDYNACQASHSLNKRHGNPVGDQDTFRNSVEHLLVKEPSLESASKRTSCPQTAVLNSCVS